MIIDSHTHLEMKDFDKDRDEVVERARQAGVSCMVSVGTTLADCKKVIALAAKYQEVYASIGVHPHDVKGIDDGTYDDLRRLAGMEKVVAYGEIGLDFFRNLSPRQDQIRRFGEQLELAFEFGLPVIVHDREAHNEIIEMLTPWRERLRGVIHCFSGDRGIAKKCLDMGFLISTTGTVTYDKADELRRVVQYVPIDSLLVETDAPYLAPVPHRGKRNEPSYVVKTAEKVAELKGLPYDKVAEATSKNAMALFGISSELPLFNDHNA